jgi:hypothetical protein
VIGAGDVAAVEIDAQRASSRQTLKAPTDLVAPRDRRAAAVALVSVRLSQALAQ